MMRPLGAPENDEDDDDAHSTLHPPLISHARWSTPVADILFEKIDD